ncbi:MAG: ferredoxin--NADP reductase [Terriglobia bacterium]
MDVLPMIAPMPNSGTDMPPANRVRFSRRRDLTLFPKQSGPPVNYFVYPYVEVDGQRFQATAHFEFRHLGLARGNKEGAEGSRRLSTRRAAAHATAFQWSEGETMASEESIDRRHSAGSLQSTSRHQVVEIVERKEYAEDLWSIRVHPEQKLPFKPGQYATLGVEGETGLVERAYSIVSSPSEETIEFFFELVPQGALTPLLYKLQTGDAMLMRRQAKGLFVLDMKSGHPKHFLVCTVTGVAPFVSITRQLALDECEGKPVNVSLVLLQAASRSWEFAYRDELEDLAPRASWFQYIPSVSRPWEDAAWQGEVGRAEDVLRKYLDSLSLNPAETTAYLCGHPGMIENAHGILARRGFTKASVKEEQYWVPSHKPAATVAS